MIYVFAACRLDTERLELFRDGAAEAVEPQVFSLLVHLIENREHVVTREALIDAVWDGRIVSDATLSSRINAARRAVGDSGKVQAVIRTVPRRGFRFVAAVRVEDDFSGVDGRSRTPEPLPDRNSDAQRVDPVKPSVAVLPFRNLSSDAEQEYFADGITEDVITALARFRELAVIARHSTFEFRDQTPDTADIGRRLGARYIVSGSVRRSGAQIRISAQLVEAATGAHVWADRWDREIGDIFAVQDELTRTIAATLGVRVQDALLDRSLLKDPADLDAYDCVLQARRYTALLDEAVHARARDLLERAIALDPGYAQAHALLANIYLAEHRFGSNPLPDPIGRAERTARRAVELDPQNAYAHCWLAVVYYFRHENERFEDEAGRALALNPYDAEILADVGHYYAFMGQQERGVALTRQAMTLNPLHPGWYHFAFARHHYARRDYAQAARDVARVKLPEFYWEHLMNAACLGQLGERDRAAMALARMAALKPGLRPRDEMVKWNSDPADLEHLLEGLAKAGYSAA
jgi:TolB-like protein